MALLLCCCSRYDLVVWRTESTKRRGRWAPPPCCLVEIRSNKGNLACCTLESHHGTNSPRVVRWSLHTVVDGPRPTTGFCSCLTQVFCMTGPGPCPLPANQAYSGRSGGFPPGSRRRIQAEPLVLSLFLFLARSSSPSQPLSISIYLSLSLSLARSRILLARLGGYCLLGSAACRRILLARLGGYW